LIDEIPRLLKKINFRLALVSFTKNQTKKVSINLVAIAGTIKGTTIVIAIFTKNDQITNGL
jgi:RNase P/RNase MRP subunit POP5